MVAPAIGGGCSSEVARYSRRIFTPGTDCDDSSAQTYPGAASAEDPDACMIDGDGDGYGDAHPMNPEVTPGADCFDDKPLLSPAQTVLVTAPLTSGEIHRDSTVLYAHLGGQPALNAYSALFTA